MKLLLALCLTAQAASWKLPLLGRKAEAKAAQPTAAPQAKSPLAVLGSAAKPDQKAAAADLLYDKTGKAAPAEAASVAGAESAGPSALEKAGRTMKQAGTKAIELTSKGAGIVKKTGRTMAWTGGGLLLVSAGLGGYELYEAQSWFTRILTVAIATPPAAAGVWLYGVGSRISGVVEKGEKAVKLGGWAYRFVQSRLNKKP